jgi:WhiB family redox-sensing transcriptional regulator
MTAVIDPINARHMNDSDVLDAMANGVDWRVFARCQREPSTFAIIENDKGEEPSYPTADQALCCHLCPVRTVCLQHALDAREPAGVWGGMTTYQRGLLTRVRARKSCPGCSSKEIITEGYGSRTHEVCTACGVSWQA